MDGGKHGRYTKHPAAVYYRALQSPLALHNISDRPRRCICARPDKSPPPMYNNNNNMVENILRARSPRRGSGRKRRARARTSIIYGTSVDWRPRTRPGWFIQRGRVSARARRAHTAGVGSASVPVPLIKLNPLVFVRARACVWTAAGADTPVQPGSSTAGDAARWISPDSFWCVFRKSISVMNGLDRRDMQRPCNDTTIYITRRTVMLILLYSVCIYRSRPPCIEWPREWSADGQLMLPLADPGKRIAEARDNGVGMWRNSTQMSVSARGAHNI